MSALWNTVPEAGIISELFGRNQRKPPEPEVDFGEKKFFFAFLVF